LFFYAYYPGNSIDFGSNAAKASLAGAVLAVRLGTLKKERSELTLRTSYRL
jgi:hypothetical protein